MEAVISEAAEHESRRQDEGRSDEETGELVLARAVKYHRDRDFLDKASRPDPPPALRFDPPPALRSDPAPALRFDPAPALRSDPPPALRSDPAPALRSDPAPALRFDPAPIRSVGPVRSCRSCRSCRCLTTSRRPDPLQSATPNAPRPISPRSPPSPLAVWVGADPRSQVVQGDLPPSGGSVAGAALGQSCPASDARVF